MQKYFFDTEFSEGVRRPIKWLPTIFGFNKPRWFIELISIGIVCEDGRRYYAINDSFSRSNCNDWVKENVLSKLPKKYTAETVGPEMSIEGWMPQQVIQVKNPLYKSTKKIACEINMFANPHLDSGRIMMDDKYWIEHSVHQGKARPLFYAYFADYDWVVLCSLFGCMMNLPKGFPMYCIDLKQMLDEEARMITDEEIEAGLAYDRTAMEHFQHNLKLLKGMPEYPQQGDSEHSAIDDADFNFRLYNFIIKLRKARLK